MHTGAFRGWLVHSGIYKSLCPSRTSQVLGRALVEYIGASLYHLKQQARGNMLFGSKSCKSGENCSWLVGCGRDRHCPWNGQMRSGSIDALVWSAFYPPECCSERGEGASSWTITLWWLVIVFDVNRNQSQFGGSMRIFALRYNVHTRQFIQCCAAHLWWSGMWPNAGECAFLLMKVWWVWDEQYQQRQQWKLISSAWNENVGALAVARIIAIMHQCLNEGTSLNQTQSKRGSTASLT